MNQATDSQQHAQTSEQREAAMREVEELKREIDAAAQPGALSQPSRDRG